MARVTFINSILSGKLAGVVFGRNKAGYYARGWAKPTDPRSAAQLAARASFESAMSTWHGLTDAFKAGWNTFAATDFHAKKADPSVVYSGINAFTSLRSIAINANRNVGTISMVTPSPTVTFGTWLPPTAGPPVGVFGTNIASATSTPIAQSLLSAGLSLSTGVDISISLGSSQSSAPNWVDPSSGVPSGYIVYGSLPTVQEIDFKNKPEMFKLISIGYPTVSTGWTPTDKVDFNGIIDPTLPSSVKQWYTVGQAVLLSVYCSAPDGRVAFLGAKTAIITS